MKKWKWAKTIEENASGAGKQTSFFFLNPIRAEVCSPLVTDDAVLKWFNNLTNLSSHPVSLPNIGLTKIAILQAWIHLVLYANVRNVSYNLLLNGVFFHGKRLHWVLKLKSAGPKLRGCGTNFTLSRYLMKRSLPFTRPETRYTMMTGTTCRRSEGRSTFVRPENVQWQLKVHTTSSRVASLTFLHIWQSSKTVCGLWTKKDRKKTARTSGSKLDGWGVPISCVIRSFTNDYDCSTLETTHTRERELDSRHIPRSNSFAAKSAFHRNCSHLGWWNRKARKIF